MHVPSTT